MPNHRPYRGHLVACLALFLGAAGCSDSGSLNSVSQSTSSSGSVASSSLAPSTEIATGSLVLSDEVPTAEASALVLQPTYHLLPVFPLNPTEVDSSGLSTSASMAPQVTYVPGYLSNLSTRDLTPTELSASAPENISPSDITPTVAVTYSPAQIRAAYGLPTLPSSFTGLTTTQAAQMGAGQTIYIVDAYHDLAAFTEFSAFNQRFGLPAATNKTLAASATLPLPVPSTNACDFYQVYSTATGGMTATAPAYDANWAIEIALDVQSAHAIAPLARIVLIEAPDASSASLTGAIQLANRMGPGVVSMSFGGPEGSYVSSLDSYFKTSGMSYFAATGDNGAAVSWPAVSPYVVAVSGTTLTYTGNGPRTETVWSGTGGGVSAYVATPSYQNSAVPGMGTPVRRSVGDVCFNADPNTGQYVAVVQNQTSSSSQTVSWLAVGGTSLATPQWAALVAIANSIRSQAGNAPLGDPHTLLYSRIASVPANYSVDFLDITQGSDGAGASNTAKAGYDTPSGLGSPNGSAILSFLSNSTNPPPPPVVSSAAVNATAGQALTFTASITDSNPYTLSLSGAPSGMSIATSGVVSWPSPVTGNYNVTVVAKDTVTGLSGQGVYSIAVAAAAPPVVTPGNLTASVGQALSFTPTVKDANPYTLTLTGAPSGMAVSSSGVVTWSSPVAGTYAFTVVAKDSKTSLSGSGSYSLTVSAAKAPTVSSASLTGKAGTPLSFNVTVVDTNPYSLSLTGAPSGMSITASGTVSWPSPTVGNFTVGVVAKDTKTGATGQGSYAIQITATGPVITATVLTGVAGKPLTGSINIADTNKLASVVISGIPLGMSFTSSSGSVSSVAVSWPSPVAGTYSLQVTATDVANIKTTVTIPVTINSH